ncbi:ISKra4 family transposase [Streptomyces sp. NPDC087532]|uniref:ISKra4 family transposase n=1 Tax=Streptomyces sp. NPDC087532 TaxID=3365795 RepID=UPI00380BE258
MEQYDTHATADPFACSVNAFETLMGTLSGDQASAWTHAELEEHLDAAGRELLRQLLQDHLDLRALREEEQVRAGASLVVVGPEGRVRPWRETGHARWLASLFGLVRFTRVAHRGPGVGNVHPADEELSLPAGRHSLGLRRLAVTEAVRGSFDQAHDAVTRRCGKVLGKRRLEELVIAAAIDVDAFYRAQIPVPCSRQIPLVLQVDGKGVVMRPEALREATRRAAVKAAAAGGHRGRLAPGEKAWAADHLTTILAGHAARTAAEMTADADREGLPATRRETVDACHRYLTGHLDQLRYDTALANGWPIATGAVEGACRHLIADRLDITGARWGLPGAEAVLRLRTLVANGDLDAYWRFHSAHEHERLYPAPGQENYNLTA